MTWLSQNVAALPRDLKRVLPTLQALKPLPITACRKVKNAVTAQVVTREGKKVFLHSKYDPVKEANKQAEPYVGCRKVLAIGFGLGYQLQALRVVQNEDIRISVAIPDLQNLWTAMHHLDLQALFQDERFGWFAAQDANDLLPTIAAIYRDFDEAHDGLLVHQASLQGLDETARSLSYIFRRRSVEKQTVDLNRAVILKNLINNLPFIGDCSGIHSLRKCWQDRPVVVVASGPSLNAKLPLLKAMRKRFGLIAVSSAVAVLQKAGIQPDVVVVIDPKAHTLDQLQVMTDRGSTLMLTSTVVPTLFQLPHFEICVAYSGDDPLMQALEEKLPRGLLNMGGSSANACLALAHWFGAYPVALIGQDLALSRDEDTHAKGVVTSYMENPTDFDRIQVRGVFSESVQTLKKWFHYLEWIEWFAKSHDVGLVQVGEEGARIQGTQHVSFRSWLHQQPLLEKNLAKVVTACGSQKAPVQVDLQGLKAWLENQIHGMA
jgi:hypothetical protein